MKNFEWNKEKNKWLKENRGISFEEIVFCLENGGLLDRYKHPNHEKYPRQFIFVIQTNDYVCLVPHVEEEDYYFLKTIIPNRIAKKKYTEKSND